MTNTDVEGFFRAMRATGSVDEAACIWVRNHRDTWEGWARVSLTPHWKAPFSVSAIVLTAVSAAFVAYAAHDDGSRSRYQNYRIRGLPFLERISWELGIPTRRVPVLI